jgi:hypothetical protein
MELAFEIKVMKIIGLKMPLGKKLKLGAGIKIREGQGLWI